MLNDFREFAVKGNVVDMAVGIIIGGAFATIAKSLVDDILMPPIGLIIGNVDVQDLFVVLRAGEQAPPYLTLLEATTAGAVTLNYGRFINNVVSFILVAFAVFLLVRALNRLRRQQQEKPIATTEKNCPYCVSAIPLQATRCPQCTSQLQSA